MRQRFRSELQAIHDYASIRMWQAESGSLHMHFWGRSMCWASYTINGSLPGLIPELPIPLAMQPLVEAQDYLDLTY